MNDQRKFPQTYVEFEGKKEINGKRRKYWIQDLEEDRFEEVIYHVLNGFLGEEPMLKYLGISEDAFSLKELEGMWRGVISKKWTIICLTKDETTGQPKLAGFNVLVAKSKDEGLDFKVEGRVAKTAVKMNRYMEKQRDFCKEFNLDYCMKAMGLYVLPEFRGDGLGYRMLDARELICKSLGIKGSVGSFSSVISQKLAYRVGFQDFFVEEYDELSKIVKEMNIPGIKEHTKHLKYMYKLYE